MQKWHDIFNKYKTEEYISFIVCNKSDLKTKDSEIQINQAKEFAESVNGLYIETCSRTKNNTQKLFDKILKEVHEKNLEKKIHLDMPRSHEIVNIQKEQESKCINCMFN